MSLRFRLKVDYYVGGLIHLSIKPLVVFLGWAMKRDHDLANVRDIAVLKLLGGGSLVMAYPSLLALKARAAPGQFRLLTLAGTQHFAEVLGIFDEIILIRDNHPWTLLVDSLRAIRTLWRCDALIDFEVHSRLSTIFCLLTCARNRVGFYTQESFWRRSLSTHLLFFHLSSRVHFFYEQVVKLFDRSAVPFADASDVFRRSLGLEDSSKSMNLNRITLAPCCSALARERMVNDEEWARVIRKRAAEGPVLERIDLLGGPSDQQSLEKLREVLRPVVPTARIEICAAGRTLRDRITALWESNELYAIDSAILHIARLLQIRCTSFWGPSSPRVYMHSLDLAPHVIAFANLPCSPCVHVTPSTPCHGNNLCMRLAVDPTLPIDRNPPWLAQIPPEKLNSV